MHYKDPLSPVAVTGWRVRKGEVPSAGCRGRGAGGGGGE